jgi:hypothetical protein
LTFNFEYGRLLFSDFNEAKMKSKTLSVTLVGLAIIILSGYTIFKLIRVNEQTRAKLPYLDIGEQIKYFDLIDEDSSRLDSTVINSGRPAMIFIFSRPCTPCQKNLGYWQKFKEILDGQMDFYGIALADASSTFNFAKQAKLNLKLYAPGDLNKFIQVFRIKLNLPQTIIYAQKEVKYLKLGDLEADEAVQIIAAAKRFIKTTKNTD